MAATSSTAFSDDKGKVRDRRIQVFQDTLIPYPELWLEVYVEGPHHEAAPFAEWLMRCRCTKADSPDEADLVIFAGGSDVDPQLYGEQPHCKTHFNLSRDKTDIELFNNCVTKGIPMFGVCRGAQFLHVMNKGKLFQHVDGHYGDHPIYDNKNSRIIKKTSSVHHQMVRPNDGMEVIAEAAGQSQERWMSPNTCSSGKHNKDIEAFFYRATCCLGVQGHPEYIGYHEYSRWCAQLLQDYVNYNPDILSINRYRRLDPNLIKQHKAKWKEVN